MSNPAVPFSLSIPSISPPPSLFLTPKQTPTSLKGVTPEWLTSLLRSSSLLDPSTSAVGIEKSTVEGMRGENGEERE
jgi:hypothetical protein